MITIAAAVDRAFVLPALFYAASFVGLAFHPELGFYAVAAGNVVLVITVMVYTARARPRGEGSSGSEHVDAAAPDDVALPDDAAVPRRE